MPIAKVVSTNAVDGKIYAISGDGTVTIYDPVRNEWTEQAAQMPTRRWGASTSVVNGTIYVIGGTIGARIVFPTVEAYDTGFNRQAVEAKEKLATLWGKLKVGR